MREGGVVYWLHGDRLGSTSLATDVSGTVVAQVRYTPYGETRWVSGTLPTDFTFAGQRADAELDLIHMGGRWYNSSEYQASYP
jgi:hypothetical protein